MEPALLPGDWLLVRRPLRAGRPGPGRAGPVGRVRPARPPAGPGMLLVKRAARRDPGGWWLVSDNPDAGAVDSRAFGCVPPELVEGRVVMRYWPAVRNRRCEPRLPPRGRGPH